MAGVVPIFIDRLHMNRPSAEPRQYKFVIFCNILQRWIIKILHWIMIIAHFTIDKLPIDIWIGRMLLAPLIDPVYLIAVVFLQND